MNINSEIYGNSQIEIPKRQFNKEEFRHTFTYVQRTAICVIQMKLSILYFINVFDDECLCIKYSVSKRKKKECEHGRHFIVKFA